MATRKSEESTSSEPAAPKKRTFTEMTELEELSGGRACKPDTCNRFVLSTSYAESKHPMCHPRQQCHDWQDSLHDFCTFDVLSGNLL